MPKLARPVYALRVEAAIDAFGNRARVSILGSLSSHGPATRGELAQRLGLAQKTVQAHLRHLEDAGLVAGDPSPDERRSGQRVEYRPLPEAIDASLADLADVLHGRAGGRSH